MNEFNKYTADSLLVVLVVYEKSLSNIFFLKSFYESDNVDIFIYDNSLMPQINSYPHLNIKYVHDSSNPGVSTAYNKAFQYAFENNKSAVLLLDQDTNFDSKELSLYIDKLNEYGDGFIYAPVITDADSSKIYSPSYMSFFVGKALSVVDLNYSEIYNLSRKSIINSGLLIPLNINKTVGGYNNRIKLDFSDIYFVEKYKEINKNIILLDFNIKHSLSGDEGYNRNRELNRFKFYCVGARELSLSLDVNTLYTVFRRLIRLVIKYRTFEPLKTMKNYYFGDYSI